MSKPKWWTDTYDKMTSPLEKFGYLVGLSGMTWEDCCDAWYYSVRLLPEIGQAISDIEWQRDQFKGAAEEWMKRHDALKAKYEPMTLVLSKQEPTHYCAPGKSGRCLICGEVVSNQEGKANPTPGPDALRGDEG